LATVYRVLTQFEQAGILSRSHFEKRQGSIRTQRGQHHDHLVCLDCGKVEEFYDAEIEKRQQAVAKPRALPSPTTPEPVRQLHQKQLPQPAGRARGVKETLTPVPLPQACEAVNSPPQSGSPMALRCRSTNS